MGATRTDIHTRETNEMAVWLQALAHPARLRILDILMTRNECVGHHLVQELGLAQPTVHQHLKRLKEVGFIQGSIDGNQVCYCVNAEMLKKAGTVLGDFLGREVAPFKC